MSEPAENENELNEAYDSGRTDGYRKARDQIVAFVKERAAENFVAGLDDKAKWLRDVAFDIDRKFI